MSGTETFLDYAAASNIQDFLCFPGAYALMSCSRQANQLLQDFALYELSARRQSLIMQVPSYIAFSLRTPGEVELSTELLQQANAPPILPQIMRRAAEVDSSLSDIEHVPAASTPGTGNMQPDRKQTPVVFSMKPMKQAKVTHLFVKGILEYEAKNWAASEQKLQEALDLVPGDDILMSRLGDTCFGKFQAIKAGHDTGDEEEWRRKTLSLYQQALQVNPLSSYGYNGLSLFQNTSRGKNMCLLRAVSLDPENSYALINLAMDTEAVEERLNLARRAVTINPKLFYARSTIAHCFIELGRFQEALHILKEQLSHRPDDRHARQFHDQLERALERAAAAAGAAAAAADDVEDA